MHFARSVKVDGRRPRLLCRHSAPYRFQQPSKQAFRAFISRKRKINFRVVPDAYHAVSQDTAHVLRGKHKQKMDSEVLTD